MKFTGKDMKLWIDDEPINCRCVILPTISTKIVKPLSVQLTSRNKMEKDYSLLRPFDLEAAKRGEKICWSNLPDEVEYIGVTRNGDIAYESGNELDFCSSAYFRMAPLAWVEGKPVYKGDVIYRKLTERTQKVVVEELVTSDYVEYLRFENGEGTEYADDRTSCLTWQKPKTKREGWLEVCHYKIHSSLEEAEKQKSMGTKLFFAKWEE